MESYDQGYQLLTLCLKDIFSDNLSGVSLIFMTLATFSYTADSSSMKAPLFLLLHPLAPQRFSSVDSWPATAPLQPCKNHGVGLSPPQMGCASLIVCDNCSFNCMASGPSNFPTPTRVAAKPTLCWGRVRPLLKTQCILPLREAQELCEKSRWEPYATRDHRRKVYGLFLIDTELDFLEVRLNELDKGGITSWFLNLVAPYKWARNRPTFRTIDLDSMTSSIRLSKACLTIEGPGWSQKTTPGSMNAILSTYLAQSHSHKPILIRPRPTVIHFSIGLCFPYQEHRLQTRVT